MVLEEIKTEKEFVDYFQGYGNHVIVCLFDIYGVRKCNSHTYELSVFNEKHRPNEYNNNIIKTKQLNASECVDFIISESRREKINKINCVRHG